MEIKTEPEDFYTFTQTSKTLSTQSGYNSTFHIKTEDSDSEITSPLFTPDESQRSVVYIKQEECKSNYENIPTFDENPAVIFPKCEGLNKKKRFSCSLCKYTSNRRKDLFVHRETHKIISYIKCSKCGMYSKDPRNVNNSVENVPFNCDSCRYKPAKKCSENMKSKAKYFYCNSCGFKAAGMSRFQMMHELVCHKVEKPFICYSCDYKCVTQSALTDHLVTHIGGNPFPCSICCYRTNSKENLEAHVITHKPFVCTTCDYRCATQSTLNKHLKTHDKMEDQQESLEETKMFNKMLKSAGLKQLQTVKTEEVCINVDSM